MIVARPLGFERGEAFARAVEMLGIPASPSQYLHERMPWRQVLLTGLGDAELRFLRHLTAQVDDPGREPYGTVLPGSKGRALLTGRREQVERVAREARAQGLPSLADALAAVERVDVPPAPLALGGRTFEFGQRTGVMAVLNVTPDSFSDGGKFLNIDEALAHARGLVKAGADLLDVGGESTRPGAPPVSEEEERARVVPVIARLRAEFPSVPVSIDTSKPAVAKAALDVGATLVNDVTGFRAAGMVELLAETGAAGCAMHMRGDPKTMQVDPRYGDVVAEVIEALAHSLERAERAGVRPERLLVDPGFGFGKTLEHNLALLRELGALRVLGRPILAGTSRKSFLGKLSRVSEASARVIPSVVSVALLAVNGVVDLVRVHDVEQTRQALAVAEAARIRREGGPAPVRSAHGE